MNDSDDLDSRREETKRTARILELIQIIALRPGEYSRRLLAERFEVSDRMIRKALV